MKKILTIAAAFLGFTFAANAQSNASGAASQSVQLTLSNALEITFTGNNSANGATVNLPFTTVNDYANGVESADQEIKVRSNKAFTVTVKTSGSNFSVNWYGYNLPTSMPTSILGLAVTANNTGGALGTGFSSTSHKAMSSTATNLITNGTYGGNQTFSVKYKATPGFAYPAGTYSTDVVYTATQQ